VLKKEDKNSLRRFERKIIRKIYGPIKQGEPWRTINNEEIDEILKEEDIVTFIKARRIKWLGHVERMNASRMSWEILYVKIYTKRIRDRSKLRWFVDVREDLRILKVKN
jgi:hypothetical protein